MQQQTIPLDILNIETFIWPPVLETAGEICLRSIREGKKVGFVYLGENNPDDELPRTDSWRGPKKERKVRQFSRLIRRKGAAILDPPEVPPEVRSRIEELSRITFSDIPGIKEFRYKGAAIGLGVVSSLISKTRDPDPCLSTHTQLISTYMREALIVFEQTILLIEACRPKAILTFNGRFALSKPIWEAARIKGVEILFHERGADYTRFILQNRPVHDFSHIRSQVMEDWEEGGPEKVQTGHTFYTRRKQGDGIGWMSFTDNQERGLVPERKQRKRIVYFSSSDDEYAAIGDLVSSPLFPSQREAIEWLIRYVEGKPDTELIIRLHPNKLGASERERSWWEGLHGHNVTVIKPRDRVDSYALAESADVVTSYGSTIGIESAYWGTPSILLGDAVYRGMGCVYEPESLQNLEEMLSEKKLGRLPAEKCLPYGYYCVTRGDTFSHYRPDTLFSGSFMGVKLTTEIPAMLRLRRIKNFFRGIKGAVQK
ncbi:MAG: hypothetical protein ACLQHK_07870 [Gallionellaceae bacterium]